MICESAPKSTVLYFIPRLFRIFIYYLNSDVWLIYNYVVVNMLYNIYFPFLNLISHFFVSTDCIELNIIGWICECLFEYICFGYWFEHGSVSNDNILFYFAILYDSI